MTRRLTVPTLLPELSMTRVPNGTSMVASRSAKLPNAPVTRPEPAPAHRKSIRLQVDAFKECAPRRAEQNFRNPYVVAGTPAGRRAGNPAVTARACNDRPDDCRKRPRV